MKKEIYTIAIMSFSGRPMRTFSISKKNFILASASVLSFIVLVLTLGSLVVWGSYHRQAQEATATVQKYETLEKNFQILQAELREIRRSYKEFKSILGSEPADFNDGLTDSGMGDLELVGKGGPEMPELSSDSLATTIADELTDDLSHAMKEATFLKTDLKDLIQNASTKMAEFATIPSICPILVEPGKQYRITSGYGRRRNPFTGVWENHEGIDIAAPLDTPIMATAQGTIDEIGQDRYLGNFVVIRHNKNLSTLYGHMNRFADNISKGSKVERHDTIGYIGKTGMATWYHVHYEVRVNGKRVNPMDYILN